MAVNGDHKTSTGNGASQPDTRWAAISGLWHFSGNSAQYQPPQSSESVQSYGIAVTNRHVTDGTVRTRVRFSDQPKSQNSAGVLLGYQSERARYLMLQLGAYDRAYSIGEWVPGTGWQSVESAGSARNLEANREYDLLVRQTGQEIRVTVDGVAVLERVVGNPLAGSQVGLFAWGNSPTSFADFSVEAAKPQMFVAMQFGQPFDTLYQEVIFPRSAQLGLNVVRIDEIAGPGIIFEDIKKRIAEAKIVVAEITAPNQNVFYELGYAHALNKPTILLAQRGKELPFDIRSYRVIFYDDSIGGKPALERDLERHLQAILGET
ncbi:MAG: hypothetical protein U0Q16_12000 [Bryobacteraceae bacterium]